MNATVVCVLGMHRSGTSVFTRVLNLLGVHLGPPDRLMQPLRDNNEEGFWEHTGFVDLNDAVLARFRGTWDEPPAFPPHWQRSMAVADLREQVAGLVQADFSERALWGWKDPRNCLTLPFWQTVLPPMRHVICLRSPLSVSRSLQRRDHFPIDKGGRLWLRYVASALLHTEGHARLIVSYERLLADPEREVRRIAEFIGRPEALAGDVRRAVGGTIRQDLRHHQGSLQETLSDGELPFPARALYAALCLSNRDSGENAGVSLAEDGALVTLVRAAGEEQADLDHIRAERDGLLRKAEELERAREEEQADLDHIRAERDGLLRKAEELERAREDVHAQLAETARTLAAITGSSAWALVSMLRPLRLALAPRGTRRERILGLGTRAVRLWHSRGFRAFWLGARRRARRAVSPIPSGRDLSD